MISNEFPLKICRIIFLGGENARSGVRARECADERNAERRPFGDSLIMKSGVTRVAAVNLPEPRRSSA